MTRPVMLAALPTAAVAFIAGVVSYTHVYALAVRTQQGSVASHLLPLSLDGLIVAGSAILLGGSRLGWLGVALGVVGTLFANVVSMLPHGHLSATVASWPAIAFTVASFMLERWLKSQVSVPNGTCEPGQMPADQGDVSQPGPNGTAIAAPAASNGHSAGWAAVPTSGWS